MKFKLMLLVCVILNMSINVQADSKLDQTLAYVRQNPAKITQTTAGIITLGAGSIVTAIAAYEICTKSKDRILSFIISCITVPVAYSGYHTFNNVLDNKPNNLLKTSYNKLKAQLQKPKLNEQK